MVSGEPAPKVTWERNKGTMDDSAKYKTRYDARNKEHILEVRNTIHFFNTLYFLIFMYYFNNNLDPYIQSHRILLTTVSILKPLCNSLQCQDKSSFVKFLGIYLLKSIQSQRSVVKYIVFVQYVIICYLTTKKEILVVLLSSIQSHFKSWGCNC